MNNLTDLEETQQGVLSVDLDDATFLKNTNALIKDYQDYYKDAERDVFTRRKKNKQYLLGKQTKTLKLKKYQAPYLDNVLYEGQSYLVPLAMSRMPDLAVKATNASDTRATDIADELTKVVETDIKSRMYKRVIALAFKHLPIYFTGVIKAYWNPEKGRYGDYDFCTIVPDQIAFDPHVPNNDTSQMLFVGEKVKYSVQEWVMRFPKKEQELYQHLKDKTLFNEKIDENTQEGMNMKIEGWEIHFTHYQKNGNKYEKQECIGWICKDLVMDKMKTPNWDWEGDTQYFDYTQNYITPDKIKSDMASYVQDPTQAPQYMGNTTYRNYFDSAQKPYFFMGYDQYGESPLDATSTIEQSIILQENLDKRGRQVTDMLDKAHGKHVFSGLEGMKKKDVEEMDLNNPDQDIFVKGDVTKVHSFIPNEQPSAQMINDKNEMRERIFGKIGTNSAVRGEMNTDTAATNNQIAREADFTRTDNLVDDTINAAAEWMAHWIMQFMFLRYKPENFQRILGEKAEEVYNAIKNDTVRDGLIVTISASGTDKANAQKNATEMAKMKLTDPLTYYKDMGLSDPEGRAKKLMIFLSNPAQYIEQYLSSPDDSNISAQMGAKLNGQSPQAMMDIAQIEQGQIPPTPEVIDPLYVTTFSTFMQSPEVEQLIQQYGDQFKQQLMQFAQEVVQKGQGSQTPAIGENNGPSPIQPAQNPNPTDTSQMPTTPPAVNGTS
jgi:hypothetical protein